MSAPMKSVRLKCELRIENVSIWQTLILNYLDNLITGDGIYCRKICHAEKYWEMENVSRKIWENAEFLCNN